jgi:hypothetical protein
MVTEGSHLFASVLPKRMQVFVRNLGHITARHWVWAAKQELAAELTPKQRPIFETQNRLLGWGVPTGRR